MLDMVFDVPEVLNLYVDQLERTPQAVRTFLDGTVRGYLDNRRLAELGQIPGAVVLPIQWTTPLQQRAFFASKGFGKGIPTQRTNAIPEGWKTVISLEDLQVGYLNDHPGAEFVIGAFQQFFHARTGWKREDLLALNILTEPALDDILLEGWISIVDIQKSLI